MTDKTRLDRIFDFILEIDKEKKIVRQTYLTGAARKEDDAEHAWHMAVMALLLSDEANSKVDLLKVVSMLLVHDLIEIYAGDTYCYDAEAVKSQAGRERAAADRLYALLPDDLGTKLRALWEEFEANATPEACFAKTLDNLQPCMLNAATDGKAWAEHRVKLSQILHRNANTAKGSQKLWEYQKERFIRPALEKGRIIADTELK